MKNIYKLSVVIGLLLVTGGCKKYLDINTNPVVPQETKAEFLLPPIIYQMTNGTAQDYRVVEKITQNLAGVSADVASVVYEQHGYVPASDVGGVIWRMTYADLGLNLENMINDGLANQKYEYVGIGYAIKAWAYQMCTDMYGPIILDDAFKPGLLSFTYQDQPDVYAKVREYGQLSLKYLDMKSPISYAAVLASVSGDGIYRGDMAKWKKFVYAIYAQQYSHLINKPEFRSAYADSVSKYVDLSFIDESESATVNFTATAADDANPLGPLVGNLTASTTYYGRPTTTILGYLTGGVRGTPTPDAKTSVDPRLSRLIAPSTAVATAGVYQGVQVTHGSNTPTVPLVYGALPAGATAYNGKYVFADAARYPIMTYSQLQFAKAEAAFIKGNSATAYTAYKAGISGHMAFCNLYGRASKSPDPAITDAEINTYLASPEVAQSAADLKIADIMGQKYIAQWGWAGMETWCDLRKYHYDPTVFRTYYQLTGTEIYPQNNNKYAYRFRPRYNSEYAWNASELEKWGGLKTDYMTLETWFSLPNN
jgi:hypothetical protein